MERSVNVNWVTVVDGAVQVYYILADFLSSRSMNYRERSVAIPYCGYVCNSLQFYAFLLLVLLSSIFGA